MVPGDCRNVALDCDLDTFDEVGKLVNRGIEFNHVTCRHDGNSWCHST